MTSQPNLCRIAKRSACLALLLALCGLAGAAAALDPTQPTTAISVEHARIRLLPGDLPLAGYFDLHNTGDKPLVLTGVTSPAFAKVMLHHSMVEGATTHMQAVPSVTVAPAATFHFAPGGYHLMLMHRKHRLRVGDQVPVTLHFGGQRMLDVTFPVAGAGTT